MSAGPDESFPRRRVGRSNLQPDGRRRRRPWVLTPRTVPSHGAPWTRCLAVVSGLLCGLLLAAGTTRAAEPDGTRFLIVVGAPGEPGYATNFTRQANAWSSLAERTGGHASTIGLDTAATNDLEVLQHTLAAEPRGGSVPLVLVLIGHGTFDGRDAKFNLRGPDLSTTNLQQWLQPIRRPLAVIDTASASAPFLNRLSRSNRVIITATRSGHEHNATRFGSSLAEALSDPRSDLDQDGETSLLEAFLSGATRVAEYFKSEGRLATEHPLIDDNGDGLGTPAEWFRGTRATRKAVGGTGSDGLRAHQFALVPGPESQRLSPELRARRDELEIAVAELRDHRPATPDEEYYGRLEVLLLELAKLQPRPTPGGTNGGK